MVVIPRYEPVFVEPNHKEYEVQVLQMSVNMDDVDHAKMDFSRQQRFDPGFNLDSVSYITHDTSLSENIRMIMTMYIMSSVYKAAILGSQARATPSGRRQ